MAGRPDQSIQRPFASAEAGCALAKKNCNGRLAVAFIAIAEAFVGCQRANARRAIVRSPWP